mmetsp:Transcript_40004/g.83290  ORF Transcript_40004/g.83290 Transcript_40004/m.83290 type:complete len:215 (+) Transcript_40004:749-1393(+)
MLSLVTVLDQSSYRDKFTSNDCCYTPRFFSSPLRERTANCKLLLKLFMYSHFVIRWKNRQDSTIRQASPTYHTMIPIGVISTLSSDDESIEMHPLCKCSSQLSHRKISSHNRIWQRKAKRCKFCKVRVSPRLRFSPQRLGSNNTNFTFSTCCASSSSRHKRPRAFRLLWVLLVVLTSWTCWLKSCFCVECEPEDSSRPCNTQFSTTEDRVLPIP